MIDEKRIVDRYKIVEVMKKHESGARIGHFKNLYYVNRNNYIDVAIEILALIEAEKKPENNSTT